MSRRLVSRCSLLVAVLAVLGVLAVGAEAGQILVKYATTVAPDHPNNLAALKFAEIVNRDSKGQVKVEVFPAAQLGNEKELVENAMLGSINLFQVGPGALSLFQSEFGIMDCPYIFRDFDHMIKTARGEIGKELSAKIEKSRGVRVLSLGLYYGARHLTTKNKAIKEPADLKGMLIRGPDQPIYLEAIRAMGATPTPVAFSDLYMALRQGVVDGQENPIPTIYSYKYYEAQKFIMLTAHMIRTIALGTNAKWYDGLPADVKSLFARAMAEAEQFNNDLVHKQETELLEKLKGLGMTVVQPNVAAFRTAAKDVPKKFEDKWGKGLYERIVAVK
jgi:tripartite ATP-independent transporter DctP family solute receptor